MNLLLGICGVITVLSLIFAGYSVCARRNLQNQVRTASENLKNLLDHDTDEKVMVFTDEPEMIALLTELNRLLDDRQKRKAEYLRTEQSSRRMLANISHDMKTPLTVILGYLEILRMDPVIMDNRMLQKVEVKAGQLMDLITGFFTLAKIESGDMELENRKIDLCEVCRRNLLDFYEILIEKEFQVVPQIPEEPVFIYGDEQALDRILFNLLSNAVRYGGDGRYLSLSLRSYENEVEIKVTDKGKGIEKQHLAHIFERLYTGDDSRSHQTEGSGLGLSIARTLCDRLGGHIAVHSVPDEETTFTVTLPVIRI